MEENKQNPGVKNPAHLLARKLQENRKSLHIARIIAKLEEQEARLQALESATHSSEKVPDEETIKMLDGKKKVIRRSSKNE